MAQPRFRGDRLRAAREAAALTEKDLTLLLGLSGPYRVKQWELGMERPQPRYIPQLAVALHIDPLGLLDVDPDDPPLAALRIAKGIGTKQMVAPGMSFMTYQRIEGGRPNTDVSEDAIIAISEALSVDRGRVEASIRRTREDQEANHIL